MDNKSYKVKGKISDALELPKDITLDMPKLTIVGLESITIENHKGIIDYCESKVSINTVCGILVINGCNLIIKSIVQEEIIVTGQLSGISF
mgnify:CR=1 FL=1